MTPNKVKCLVVDDIDDNLFTMQALLESDSVEVLTAPSGPAALELLLAHDFALALLDVHMPLMDGFELAELMRSHERTRQVPIIFVTAGTRELQRMFKGYEAGAVDFLFKPVEPWLLESKARAFFELYRYRRQLADELAARTETLRLNELFAAVLAHDLRDPLSAMLTHAALLERLADSEAARRAARSIAVSGSQMARLIGDVLDLSRTRLGGGLPLRRTLLDLQGPVERVLAEQRSLHPDHVVALQVQADDSAALQGSWDADRLSQLLTNLVGNALLHGAAGEPVQVVLDGRQPQAVRVVVDNAGVIDPTLLPRLFDPFRAAGVDRRGQGQAASGLGLGLYIVQQVAQAHGGSVDVASDAGRTRFTVTLPR